MFSNQIARAAKEFDRRVPALLAPAKGPPTTPPRWILPVLIAQLAVVVVVVGAALTIKNPASQIVLLTIIRVIYASGAFMGFIMVRTDVLFVSPSFGLNQISPPLISSCP